MKSEILFNRIEKRIAEIEERFKQYLEETNVKIPDSEEFERIKEIAQEACKELKPVLNEICNLTHEKIKEVYNLFSTQTEKYEKQIREVLENMGLKNPKITFGMPELGLNFLEIKIFLNEYDRIIFYLKNPDEEFKAGYWIHPPTDFSNRHHELLLKNYVDKVLIIGEEINLGDIVYPACGLDYIPAIPESVSRFFGIDIKEEINKESIFAHIDNNDLFKKIPELKGKEEEIKGKIKIINGDAYEFPQNLGSYDTLVLKFHNWVIGGKDSENFYTSYLEKLKLGGYVISFDGDVFSDPSTYGLKKVYEELSKELNNHFSPFKTPGGGFLIPGEIVVIYQKIKE